MTVSAQVSPNLDMTEVIIAAGGSLDDAWHYSDGVLVVGGNVTQQQLDDAIITATIYYEARELARVKRHANDEVDREVETNRSRLLRTLPGQGLVNLKKEMEADAYKANNYPPNLSGYPWLSMQVDITGYTARDIADNLIAQRDSDLNKDISIEKERQKTKIEINNQLGVEGVKVAKGALKSRLDAIAPTEDVSDSLPPSSTPPGNPQHPGNNNPPGHLPREVLRPSEALERLVPQPEEEAVEEVRAFEPPVLTLEETKEEAIYTVNALAESARQEQLEVGPAQMMVYTEKFNEATDYLVDDSPEDTTPYPFINAEVGATGKTAEQVANSIIDKKGEWIAFNANVERIRMVAQTHINEAQTVESVDVIVDLAAKQLDLLEK